MINLNVDEDTLLTILMNRLEYWTDDAVTYELFERYYTDIIYAGILRVQH